MEETELDVREIMRVVRRRLWVILALPAVAAVTAAAISLYALAPVYSASTTLWVIKEGAAQINLNDVMLSRNLTKTYAEVAESRAVMADALRSLGITDLSVEQLQKRLTVTPVRDTEILSFTVEDGDPVRAARMADAIAGAFKGQIMNFMKVENVRVVDQALIPTKAVRPRPLLNAAIAAVLGLMAAVGLTFLLEYLDTSIKSPEDVARHLELPVLGVIPVIELTETPAAQRRPKTRRSDIKMVVEK